MTQHGAQAIAARTRLNVGYGRSSTAAVDYAAKKHTNQKRKDGSPYIIHPLAVAEIVAEIGLDTDAILGALLHDCIEDTDSTYDDIAPQSSARRWPRWSRASQS